MDRGTRGQEATSLVAGSRKIVVVEFGTCSAGVAAMHASMQQWPRNSTGKNLVLFKSVQLR